MNKWLVVVLLLAASTAGAAVHRCRTPDGNITYTDKGCPEGQDVQLGRDRAAEGGSRKDGAEAPRAGRENFYREQIKSAQQPASVPTPQQH